MKRFTAVAAAAGLVFALAGEASAQSFSTSAHNFAAAGDWNSGGQSCSVCHTPHGSTTTASLIPLWGNGASTSPAGRSYSMYTGFDMSTGVIAASPDGTSVMCLGCHDGVGYMDAFGGSSGSAANTIGAGSFNLATALTNDHPISTIMDNTKDTELNAPSGLSVATVDAANKVQCTSCHDVHNGAGVAKMLVASNAADQICLDCHNKG